MIILLFNAHFEKSKVKLTNVEKTFFLKIKIIN